MPRCHKCERIPLADEIFKIWEPNAKHKRRRLASRMNDFQRSTSSRPNQCVSENTFCSTPDRRESRSNFSTFRRRLEVGRELKEIAEMREDIIRKKLSARKKENGSSECDANPSQSNSLACDPVDNCSKTNSADAKSDKKYIINEDWGEKTELYNIINTNKSDGIWNVLKRGIFYEIKLWRNNYGHICCKASARIHSKFKIHSDSALLQITTEKNLRKLLNLSHSQWSALCESLEKTKCSLYFNAFDIVDIDQMTQLEKLWYVLCKARHYLPDICVRGKVSGAVKFISKLKVVPKIVVTEIRDHKGEEIC